MPEIPVRLQKAVRERNLILFIGAGVSATLKLPTWQELNDHIAQELGYDKRLFREYDNSLVLAEYYAIRKGGIGELARWMRHNWRGFEADIRASSVYRNIVRLNAPIIYTTNYDHCLETAFAYWDRPYHKIVRVEDFVDIDTKKTQIIKFHGDMDDEASIVLGESSYFSRFDFESPLDIKLRADMLGKSILFLGYSLSDINMRFLFYKLDRLWQTSGSGDKRPKSYIYLSEPNPIRQAVFAHRGIEAMIGDSLDKNKNIETFLSQLVAATCA